VRPRTLRGRLVGASAIAILGATSLLGTAAGVIVDRRLHSSLDHTLRQRASDVARLSVSAPALLTTPGTLEAPAGGRDLTVEVLDAHGRIVARSLSLGARILDDPALVRGAIAGGRSSYRDARLGREPIRLFAAPIPDTGGPAGGGAVLVASSTSEIDDTVTGLSKLLVASSLLATLAAGLAAAYLTRKGLSPLRRLSRAAVEIESTGDATRRLPEPEQDDELGELSRTLNRMLAALDEARRSERRLLADASHELRTPVTALLGNVEYLARHGPSEAVIEDLRLDAERLRRLVDDLLSLEHDRAAPRPLELVDLADVVRAAADDEPRATVTASEPVAVHGDRDALQRAVGNLVENAIVHGPALRPVSISLRRAGERAMVAVRDEGPGPDPAIANEVFQRFWRAPAASGRPGSGLGLPIVRAIAERHGGTVTVDGATFTIELPTAD
jgi:two-component system sensor histidine kinase MprB